MCANQRFAENSACETQSGRKACDRTKHSFCFSIMQSVSGPKLAIELARNGGLSFIFGSQPIDSQAEMSGK